MPFISDPDRSFQQALSEAIRTHAQDIAAEEIALAQNRIAERVRAKVAQIAANICSNMAFEPYGQKQLKITLIIPE